MLDSNDLQAAKLNDSGLQTKLSSTEKSDIFLANPLAKYNVHKSCI